MKKILFYLLAALAPLSAAAQQQKADDRSHNIFVFPEFKEAKVLQPFGRSTTTQANIFLKNGALCFMQDGKVMQAFTDRILGVEFDSVQYRKVDNTKMGRVIAQKGYNYLLCVTTIDMKKLKAETTGGDNMQFLDIPDAGAFFELDGGAFEFDKGYPLTHKYYFCVGGRVFVANETNFKKYVKPDMMKAFKRLMNDRFWSWGDPASLTQLFTYLKD